MPVATLAAILGHADLRSVMKYVHVRQESQDREMELFDAKNISEAKCWSGFGPVGTAENHEFEGSNGKCREGLSSSKINLSSWRRGAGSNRRIKVLQTSALPLGYRAASGTGFADNTELLFAPYRAALAEVNSGVSRRASFSGITGSSTRDGYCRE